ncbi:MAG: iron-sulfur cluster assembly scaffold protein [Chloroflexi bacterium]|nr:iron-sulfur cluster assembly scaffold protein [Chloroflexota bacterium]
MYTATVIDHFRNPRNTGTICQPDGHAHVASTVHNDLVDLDIRVAGGRLAEIKYRVFGCVAAIASSSITSELATGLTLEEALAITPEQVAEALGGLPEGKLECSVLAPEALRQAIANYRAGQG